MRKFEEFLHSLASTVGVVSKQAMEEILRLVKCQQDLPASPESEEGAGASFRQILGDCSESWCGRLLSVCHSSADCDMFLRNLRKQEVPRQIKTQVPDMLL